ncbi:MAG: RHS repeat-associated core domain-containing protein [Fimbriimonadaceae bacterium]|nr:RHS repeat-associated core domain-containing protein [Fimbriimonadaceae bacterium]
MKNADAQTNTSGSVSASRVYDAFGAELSSTGTWQGRFGYARGFGYQEEDGGFKLLGHRYYDPSTGRFLTRDPIKDGRNWNAYCGNTPIGRIDPSGLVFLTPPPTGSISLVVLPGSLSDTYKGGPHPGLGHAWVVVDPNLAIDGDEWTHESLPGCGPTSKPGGEIPESATTYTDFIFPGEHLPKQGEYEGGSYFGRVCTSSAVIAFEGWTYDRPYIKDMPGFTPNTLILQIRAQRANDNYGWNPVFIPRDTDRGFRKQGQYVQQ